MPDFSGHKIRTDRHSLLKSATNRHSTAGRVSRKHKLLSHCCIVPLFMILKFANLLFWMDIHSFLLHRILWWARLQYLGCNVPCSMSPAAQCDHLIRWACLGPAGDTSSQATNPNQSWNCCSASQYSINWDFPEDSRIAYCIENEIKSNIRNIMSIGTVTLPGDPGHCAGLRGRGWYWERWTLPWAILNPLLGGGRTFLSDNIIDNPCFHSDNFQLGSGNQFSIPCLFLQMFQQLSIHLEEDRLKHSVRHSN